MLERRSLPLDLVRFRRWRAVDGQSSKEAELLPLAVDTTGRRFWFGTRSRAMAAKPPFFRNPHAPENRSEKARSFPLDTPASDERGARAGNLPRNSWHRCQRTLCPVSPDWPSPAPSLAFAARVLHAFSDIGSGFRCRSVCSVLPRERPDPSSCCGRSPCGASSWKEHADPPSSDPVVLKLICSPLDLFLRIDHAKTSSSEKMPQNP